MATTIETPYSVEAALRRHVHRESTSSQFGATIWQLVRSDINRLVYFDGDQVVEDYMVQRRYVPGDDERIAIEAHHIDPSLRPVFGFILSDSRARPERTAWLVNDADQVIDPARGRRAFVGAIGVVLRGTEIASWSPDHVGAVAIR